MPDRTYRLYAHASCGFRYWQADDEPMPKRPHRNPHTGEVCTDPTPMVVIGVEDERKRRERLLAEIAIEGASRCSYMPGAGNAVAWPTARCDCKYVHPATGSEEQTGCCEMRAAYFVLAATLKDR